MYREKDRYLDDVSKRRKFLFEETVPKRNTNNNEKENSFTILHTSIFD